MNETVTRTFLRGRLYGELGALFVPQELEIGDNTVKMHGVSWDKYWQEMPPGFAEHVERLRVHWAAYIESHFDDLLAGAYSEAYFALLRAVARDGTSLGADSEFMKKVLKFENFELRYMHATRPFAAVTTSFRNPVFLSFETREIRKNERNDPSLLPLIAAGCGSSVSVYFHYRKVRLLKSVDKNLLFFRAVDSNRRSESFLGLGAIEGKLASQWGSRIAQRSRLIASRVLSPLMREMESTGATPAPSSWRVLDVGAGSGLFASSLIGKLAAAGILGKRKVEMTLLDVIPRAALHHFRSSGMRKNMSKVTYVSEDYRKWLSKVPGETPRYDMVLLCRTLHNFSKLTVRTIASAMDEDPPVGERYPRYPHMSDYYFLMGRLIDDYRSDCQGIDKNFLFCPSRTFDPACLFTSDGKSIITALMHISKGVLIEDSDLTPEVLIDHVQSHACNDIYIFNLSRMLRLSLNHVYWVTRRRAGVPSEWTQIWPK